MLSDSWEVITPATFDVSAPAGLPGTLGLMSRSSVSQIPDRSQALSFTTHKASHAAPAPILGLAWGPGPVCLLGGRAGREQAGG